VCQYKTQPRSYEPKAGTNREGINVMDGYTIPSWSAIETVLRVMHWYEFVLFACTYALTLFLPIRWWQRVLGFAAVSVGLAVLMRNALLLDEGYCLGQSRRLSEQEKIDGAVREILRVYPPSIIRSNEDTDPSGKVISYNLSPPTRPIRYKDVAEFYALNPGCCEYTLRRDIDEGSIGAYSRIREEIAGFVNIRYLVRYVDESGMRQASPFKWSMPISHCGTTEPTERIAFIQ
jgi:hypothetical protein